MRIIGVVLPVLLWIFFPVFVQAQSFTADALIKNATLENCLKYAIQNNPDLHNAKINESITESLIKGKLADWYPQVNFSYNLQHSFQLPVNNFNGTITHTGTANTSSGQFGVTQNIFNRDVIFAGRTAGDVRKSSVQNTRNQSINLAVQVSKTFYNLILGYQQINVIGEDIVRLKQNLQDAVYQYQSGIVDKTDYERATISLNNAVAEQKSAEVNVTATMAFLKELMGYPDSLNFYPVYDTLQMLREINVDTLQRVDFQNRIEMQQLETQKQLQLYNLRYYQWSYLPNVSAFGNYNLNFLNSQFSKLYSAAYPNSFIGLALTVPIFQGGKRTQQIRRAQFEIEQIDNDIKSLQNSISSQYQNALAGYKSNLYNFLSLKENLKLATDVFDIIQLQYRAGVKAYLDLITAETDLRSAQINYFNALYQVLSSKIDIEQALGNIQY